MRKFVIGDIHGRMDALEDVLQRTPIDKKKDRLIILGDICDGGEDTKKVIDTLREFEDKIFILGNHDQWFLDWIKGGVAQNIWLNQGGRFTLLSYGIRFPGDTSARFTIPTEHVQFMEDHVLFYEDEDAIYVHAGIAWGVNTGLEFSTKEDFLWDRTLIQYAYRQFTTRENMSHYQGKLVIVGHTCTQLLNNKSAPFISDHVIGLDTGAGHGSKLTIMEIPSKEYWQSKIQDFKLLRGGNGR